MGTRLTTVALFLAPDDMAAMAYRAKVCCKRNGFVCIKIARGCNPFEPFFTPGEFVAFGPIGLIELDIPKKGVVLENGWFITPIGDTTISLSEVHLPGSEEQGLASGEMNACGISGGWRDKSSCTLLVQWTRPNEHPVELCYKIEVLGASPPFNFITLRIEPPPLRLSQSQSGSMLLDRVAPQLQIEPTLRSQTGSPSLPQIGSPLQSQIRSQPPQSPHLNAIISMLKKEYPTTEVPRLPLQSTYNPCKDLATEVVSLATPVSHAERSKSITKEGVPPAKKRKKQSAVTKPTLTQLMKMTTGEKVQIINSVAPQWKQLGELLDFDDNGQTLRLIEADHQQEGHIACCQEMFILWLNGKGKEATWEVLLEVLEDIDQSELARKVKTALHFI